MKSSQISTYIDPVLQEYVENNVDKIETGNITSTIIHCPFSVVKDYVSILEDVGCDIPEELTALSEINNYMSEVTLVANYDHLEVHEEEYIIVRYVVSNNFKQSHDDFVRGINRVLPKGWSCSVKIITEYLTLCTFIELRIQKDTNNLISKWA